MSRSLQEIIEEITDWQDVTFTQATPLSAVTHLQREVIELTFAIQSAHLKREGTSNLEEEIADCFFLLVAVTHLSKVNLEKAVADKMVVNLRRAWGLPDADGVVEHVHEQPPMYEGNDPRWKGKTLIEVFTDEGLIPQAPSGFENVLIIKSSAENGGKISNSPNTIN